MRTVITIAGATGHLGHKIVLALLKQNAEVHAIVRAESKEASRQILEDAGAKIFVVTNWTTASLQTACEGAACVVSALAGMREVIIDAQKILLDAAVAAAVPRFIPSDYSLDFIPFSPGENRNLDWRREFHQYLDKAPIAATSIFNGAFSYLLTGDMPLILFKPKMILYWGRADHKMGFTSVANTAIYTACAALDATTPRYLHIAGDEKSPVEIKEITEEVMGEKYKFFRPGGSGLLAFMIKMARFFAPGKTELYPAWQGMQYMHNMIDSRADIAQLDNERYPGIAWTKIKDVLESYKKEQQKN